MTDKNYKRNQSAKLAETGANDAGLAEVFDEWVKTLGPEDKRKVEDHLETLQLLGRHMGPISAKCALAKVYIFTHEYMVKP